MSTLPQSNTIVSWPNQPFTLTQDPPGIFFLHHVPEVKSFFKWILKQSLNDVPEDTQFPLVKQRIRSASPRAIQGMNIFLRAVVMLELTDKDLQNNIRGPALRCGHVDFSNHLFKIPEWRGNENETTRKRYERMCLEECGREVLGRREDGFKARCIRKVYPTHETLQALQNIVKSLEGI